MTVRNSVVGVLFAGLFATVGTVEIVGQEARTPAEYRAVLDRYCVGCHNDRLRTGNLSLDSIDSEDLSRDALTWEKVLQKKQDGGAQSCLMAYFIMDCEFAEI